MSGYVSNLNENMINQVLVAYLVDGKSHRWIQEEILGIPAPARGGGFIAMEILHYFGIYGEKKGALKWNSLSGEKNSTTLSIYHEALSRVESVLNK